eukprot:TRINITY_DN29009_c0_g1_i1.p1 TRINITY_DN29009_c0_g1~~TRINITY_DN29009_c0_g1_i1.p1  ORF type:complete len:151 (+),score=35.30 TRINITY_DN29009_c0_g1_i1:97-549(+)
MGRLLTQAALAMLAGLVQAQPAPPPAPPAPPPPVPPSPPSGPAPPVIDADEQMRQDSARHLSAMKATQHHHTIGAWLYGDYRTDDATTPESCAKACEADGACYHWNFHVQQHWCQLKGDAGGHDSDKADYITGNAMRYKPGSAKPQGSEL